MARRRVSAANGSRTHDLPVDNRTLVPLSYGDEIGHEVFKEPSTQVTLAFGAEGGGFEPPRPISEPSALAPRRDKPLCQPSHRLAALAQDRPARRERAQRVERRVRDSNPHDPKVCPFSRRVLCQFSQPSVTRSRRYRSIPLNGRRRELNPHFLVAGQESSR